MLLCALIVFAPFSAATKISISSSNHPKISLYWPLISQVYSNIGLETEIVELPSARGLEELRKGNFDADILRLAHNVDAYEEIIKISPPLGEVTIFLLCHKSVECDLTLIEDEQRVVFASSGIKNLAQQTGSQLNYSTIEAADKLLPLLTIGRIDYLVYAEHSEAKKALAANFSMVELTKVYMHHVIHKKIAHLAPEISQQLNKLLPSFNERNRKIFARID